MKTNYQALKSVGSAAVWTGLLAVTVTRPAAGDSPQYDGSRQRPVRIGCAQSYYKQLTDGDAMVPGIGTIPVKMGTPLTFVLPGETFTCSVTVDNVPAEGGYVQITCDTQGALSNDSQSWPYSIYFAPGSSATAYFSLTASSVTSQTTVKMYYGTSSADPNNPADWTAGGTVTISPPLSPCITTRKR